MAAVLARDKEAVIGNFKHQGLPIWAIYEGNKPLDSCIDKDQDDRMRRLITYLDVIELSGSTQQFEIRYYDDQKTKPTNATPYFAAFPFKVNDSEKALELLAQKNGKTVGGNDQIMMLLFQAKMDNIEQKFQFELEKKEEEIRKIREEYEEDEQYDDGMGKIGAITNVLGAAGEKFPWLQGIVKDVVSTINNLGNGMKVKYQSMTENPVQMNGVPPKPQSAETNTDPLEEDKKLLAWSHKVLIMSYRDKFGVQMDENGQVFKNSEKHPKNEELMKEADHQYVLDMVKVAEVASTKPNTYESAIKSLREM